MLARLVPLSLCLSLIMAAPLLALEYEGKNIDGRRIEAKAYYQGTGGLYTVQVEFKGNKATIYFENGGQTTIILKQSSITDLNKIEGSGRLGYWPLNNLFSIGLESEVGGTTSVPGADLWIISLDEEI
ncbi:MAG: hypothetical protein N5P05_003325 [Chroococcopsis gigantea SAG 12.99]|jgi:hypothetical protein|nr:hypothetical protein [Chroococcopsis gigantea SAG 12.99]